MDNLKDKHSQLFLLLIGTYEMAALQQMGKLKNPLTDKLERNLEQAQFSIELLDMIREKTKGNLDEQEQKFLDSIISQVKLNYVDEMDKDKKQASMAEGDGKVKEQGPKPDNPEGTQVT